MSNDTQPLAVYRAINAVQAAMSKEGIKKDQRNQQQGYAFRGIDDCYAAIAPHLAANKLCIIPRYVSRNVVEHPSKGGGTLFYVVVEGEFDFVSAEDGSKHTARMFGEAMDSADKASNKAASAAFKYLLLQTFCIPTEGDNDADRTTPEPLAREDGYGRPYPQGEPKPNPPQQNAPTGHAEGSNGALTADVMFEDYAIKTGKTTAGKAWKLFVCRFGTDAGSTLEASTFSAELANSFDTLKGNEVTISYKPGRKAGTLELVSIFPNQDDLPM